MRKILLLICFLSVLFLAAPIQAVRVDVTPSQAETYANEEVFFRINVYNEKPYAGEFVITVIGPYLWWSDLGIYYLKLGGHEDKDIGLTFYPKLEDSYEYEILAYSKTDEENSDYETIALKVLPERFVRLLDFSSEKAGDNLEIKMGLVSKEKREARILFEITDEKGSRVKYLEVTKELEDTREITETVPIGDLLAGSYKLIMSIPEHGILKETSLYIPPVHKVVKKKEVVSTPFGQEVTITVVNEGNVVEDYNVRESVPANQYVDLVEQPTSGYLEENNVNYNWRIEGLMVGATGKITYKISRLPLLVGSLVVIFCLVGLLGMGAVKVRTPNISKRYVRKRDEHLIILEIKGSLTKELRNVLVKDRVSPLGKVLPEFEGPKPIVRESESGTELIWRLGDLKPRSEIYLTYRIRPLLEAQLKMPRAYLTYRTDEDTKMRVFSRQIVLD